MKRAEFLKVGLALSLAPILPHQSSVAKMKDSIRLLRHATLVINLGGVRFLVDPMLSPKGAMDPVQNAGNTERIPLVDLPISDQELSNILEHVDAVLITHTHRDHWDAVAQNSIEKSKPIFCQPSDLSKIKEIGFKNVTDISDKLEFQGIRINRTGGKHGTGDIGQRMGDVSGFVLTKGNSRVYIAGDTIWCDEVKNALDQYKPTYTIVNAGGAQFNAGDPITMTDLDIIEVANAHTKGKLAAVHMNTVNHCIVTRAILRERLAAKSLSNRVYIPEDGEQFNI
ncbi:MAG: MBL fold metallo-hydrolase [Cyclobacteriaceae bacterium]